MNPRDFVYYVHLRYPPAFRVDAGRPGVIREHPEKESPPQAARGGTSALTRKGYATAIRRVRGGVVGVHAARASAVGCARGPFTRPLPAPVGPAKDLNKNLADLMADGPGRPYRRVPGAKAQ